MNIKFLTEQETDEFYEVLRNDTSSYGTRNRAIFHIAKYCALRVSEIGMLKFENYDSKRAEIHCERKKGSNSNTIRILDYEVKKCLDFHICERENMDFNSPYIFLSREGNPISRKTLDCKFKKYCRKTSIPREKQHFHVLKHTRAIELANLGVDIKEIQWWLGHKNINNTLIYLQFTTKQQNRLYEYLERNMYEEKNIKAQERDNDLPYKKTYGRLFS